MAESIYTWIKPDPVVPEKPALYHARASPNAPLVGSTIKVGAGTHTGMGLTKKQMKETIKPENFLRAHQNTGWVDTNRLREYARLGEGGGGACGFGRALRGSLHVGAAVAGKAADGGGDKPRRRATASYTRPWPPSPSPLHRLQRSPTTRRGPRSPPSLGGTSARCKSRGWRRTLSRRTRSTRSR